jgi:Na+/glutamate symporter
MPGQIMVAQMNYVWVGLAGIWPLIGYFAGGGTLVAGLLAAAWFSPIFKKELIWAAAVVAAFMAAFTLGVVNGEQRVRAQWTAAEENSIKRAEDARKDAERTVARKPSRWMRNNRDAYNRDRN